MSAIIGGVFLLTIANALIGTIEQIVRPFVERFRHAR